MDGRRAREAVAPHVLRDGVGGCEADDPVALRLVGFADRGHREALAGAGLAVDDRDALGAGGLTESARLLARNSVEFFRAQDFRTDFFVNFMPLVAGQTVGGAQYLPFGLKDALRRVARDRTVFDIGE